MRFLHRHILTFGRLFALVFFLANSGFTVVLYHCTMEKMDCCSASDKMPDACSMMDPPQASSRPAVTAGDDCHCMTIAGGLKTEPTVVEQESIAKAMKVDLVIAFAPDLAISSVPSPQQPASPATAQWISPHAVETYVLNSTFLI